MAESAVIRCEQFLAHSPAAVWKALTDPDLLAHWWVPGDIKPIVGHSFTLDMGAWGVQPGKVTAVEPERLLRYSFAEGSLDTTITWRLEPEGEGTRLFLEHAGFDLDSPMGRHAHHGMGEGWPHVLARIDTVLANPETDPGVKGSASRTSR
jgi:uncharacterized protein YndB with AHSA1/START domain